MPDALQAADRPNPELTMAMSRCPLPHSLPPLPPFGARQKQHGTTNHPIPPPLLALDKKSNQRTKTKEECKAKRQTENSRKCVRVCVRARRSAICIVLVLPPSTISASWHRAKVLVLVSDFHRERNAKFDRGAQSVIAVVAIKSPSHKLQSIYCCPSIANCYSSSGKSQDRKAPVYRLSTAYYHTSGEGSDHKAPRLYCCCCCSTAYSRTSTYSGKEP